MTWYRDSGPGHREKTSMRQRSLLNQGLSWPFCQRFWGWLIVPILLRFVLNVSFKFQFHNRTTKSQGSKTVYWSVFGSQRFYQEMVKRKPIFGLSLRSLWFVLQRRGMSVGCNTHSWYYFFINSIVAQNRRSPKKKMEEPQTWGFKTTKTIQKNDWYFCLNGIVLLRWKKHGWWAEQLRLHCLLEVQDPAAQKGISCAVRSLAYALAEAKEAKGVLSASIALDVFCDVRYFGCILECIPFYPFLES